MEYVKRTNVFTEVPLTGANTEKEFEDALGDLSSGGFSILYQRDNYPIFLDIRAKNGTEHHEVQLGGAYLRVEQNRNGYFVSATTSWQSLADDPDYAEDV